jgi:hypothetical protein
LLTTHNAYQQAIWSKNEFDNSGTYGFEGSGMGEQLLGIRGSTGKEENGKSKLGNGAAPLLFPALFM